MADDFIRREDALEITKLSDSIAAWNIASRIRGLPAAEVRTTKEVDEAVAEAIRILNAINGKGGMQYIDYCLLYDAIYAITVSGVEEVFK